MQSITSLASVVHFGHTAYLELNKYLESAEHSRIFILVDTNTHQNCFAHFMSNIEASYDTEIIEVEPGEIHKNIETCTGIWNVLSELGADRKSLMINLGGGVVTDMGGFIACTFKRGIKYINVPTTLLAMVDASVGGKTGVDLGNLKNMVGVISESEMVLVDPEYLETLPVNQMCSGFAEMLKHGLIKDRGYWKKLSDLSAVDHSELGQMIYDSVIIKNNIVKKDPTEQNIRKFLNFGHTLGHAIESFYLTNPDKPILLHGEAIAIGMILESYISKELTGLTNNELTEISEVILATFNKVAIAREDRMKIKELLIFDKKNENGNVYFVLLKEIGEAVFNQLVSEDIIEAAFDYYESL
ncbi:3-dehydroquinate synthase [Aquimarina sp. ERC-38]|uniref:3-dehydroquinate synthase n=1 Tax=Aquimarina sp. ERC-38 TaxID=2949996 RepID=UPI002246D6C2|nr:3-dehydroquinate synthase [Aquimarina sp. ERC-38]UZO79532.1 3-dehydroquinate synthase [Aquimarina sp. ERC-38]